LQYWYFQYCEYYNTGNTSIVNITILVIPVSWTAASYYPNYLYKSSRGGATLCTRHAHSKYIIDNRMFTIQFKNGRWSENISLQKLNVNLSSCLNLFSIWDILNFLIAILVYKKVYKYCYFFPKKSWTLWLWIFFCSVMEF
jgi:hypothetical protein